MSEKSSTEIPKKSEETTRSRKSEEAGKHENESPKTNHPHLQNFIQEVVDATNPSLRHLASQSSFNSQNSRTPSHAPSDPRSQITKRSFRPLSTNFEEQRHPGKPTLSITRSTKQWDPEIKETGSVADYPSLKQYHESIGSGIYGSDQTTLFSDPRSSLMSASGAGAVPKYKEIEISHPIAEGASSKVSTSEGSSQHVLPDEKEGAEEEETVYPGPLGLFILITGIALSVFLISLDRTIITTAIPYISDEFDSYDDIGWYGSAYLLTASAFQPLYGRVYGLFNMKWAYLTSLFMFELGSLICGISPNSLALIIGRSLAGLGSAGILTGSFVVVSHAVPLQQRPVLTAVVGLMFGVGATAGPLLGGVFTDLVTWRWCFYFNLPVGGATVAAMLFFFHPPKKHALMEKSFLYRVMELDLIGNVFLLSASVMLFLALQFAELQQPWGSAKIVGLLTGCGLMFIVFCAWQWWKADGALMPPRILKQRTVAASCGAAFCIYSAILIQSYYLPMWFQAIKGDSAIHSGVNMIPYVVANALFSLLAGIFVSKNGYFVAPAIIGMAIGTIGSGLITTFDENTSSSYWIGCEILASAGIGMAIQQGFTAVQIVLPLEEVAIGTAAVVAFQSLGGAIFVSVGNTILQNTLLDANLPGVDIQAVIDAGASDFRSKVTAEQLPGLIAVYNDALTKVFIAAVPMAGLAIFACACMEWKSVKDGKKGDLESAKKAQGKRGEIEKAILERHRRSEMSGMTVGYGSRD
ncbi:MFS general substrate transporter [Mollisia scopiformis]|uniref:MFS general substrate transporter n=1 Tax=Mollisia scopiformis TaxID=149040 RepID=A0A194X0Z8_MOLSC|nr:MFS general substrate transporter [Mollisia scopiformis]KUJ13537.1 MFS general substrate transporter [Mollisia scopiformis]